MNNKDLIHAIHQTPAKLVLITAGGGSEAISELLRYGNGSATILDLRVPYVQPAFRQVVKNEPEQYVSAAAARTIAVSAYEHAVSLTGTIENTWGIGCTSALVKDGEKPYPDGTLRKHRIFLAAHSENKTVCWAVNLKNSPVPEDRRTREAEERVNALLLLELIATVAGVEEKTGVLTYGLGEGDTFQSEEAVAPHPVSSLANNVLIDNHKLWVQTKGGKYADCNLYVNPQAHVSMPHIIFPGSFNPIHPGHRAMAEAARNFKNCPVHFEISLKNADKPALDYVSIERRCEQFAQNETVYLTSAATFVEKSRLFPNTTFLVGLDTFMRIGERKYYKNASKAFLELTGNGAKFLVARRQSDKYQLPIPQGFPEELLQLADFLPESLYNDPEAESSTNARKNGNPLELLK